MESVVPERGISERRFRRVWNEQSLREALGAIPVPDVFRNVQFVIMIES